ncbi:MAG: ATP-binding cassette domain-containing protein, partial [Proteobacteria bacterium]
KQRISIARALFKNAPLLILDEATSALDTASEIEVQKGLDYLMQGRTALIIAHRLSTIQSSDKIVVLKAGRIMEIGTHQQLVQSQGEYHRFYTLQHRI